MNSKRLSKEQQVAHSAMVALLADRDEADRRYNALADSHGGRVVSTDIARFLDTRYRDTPAGRARDLVPSWDLAWRYAQGRFARELGSRNRRRVVRFMAGGWGAGKTHALEREKPCDLAWDGTLKDTDWAWQMVNLALVQGWRVEIAYVFRDIEMAMYGAVQRSFDEGRSVPLAELPGNHRAVQVSVRKLILDFRTNPSVAFLLLHNLGAKGIEGTARVFANTELAQTGALHDSKRYEDYYTEAAREIEAIHRSSR